jgi:hypothetical protein
MATTITAGNATNGAAISSDNTGTLDIKTGTGAGTTAISINASQAVTMPGPVAIPGNLVVTGSITAGSGTPYVLNQYTSSTTWGPVASKTGLKSIKVTVVGAGGAGGPAVSTTPASTTAVGSGGGGGGAAIIVIPAPSITAPGTITVTAGPGTNSFGPWTPAAPTTVSATAGSAGANNANGGAGGVGSGGNINIDGQGGDAVAGTVATSSGGSSILGGGAESIKTSPGSNSGVAGGNYGGGSSGAFRSGPGPFTQAGVAGAPGIVIVEEFY